MDPLSDLARVDVPYETRAITFENPEGARGAGGTAHGGRKGRPNRWLRPGERVTLADLRGPATVRHLWMTFPPAPPEVMRALQLDVYYDGLSAPSISVPALDFFGLPCGRPVAYASALATAQEGRGFNAFFPMPVRESARFELTNHSDATVSLYYQIDYTLEREADPGAGLLHVAWRRENPTTMQRDFVIVEGLSGPGRFLGCNVGLRVLDDGSWYGEGEMKAYIDGDEAHPTICGTGLEDYVGSAWGMGPHAGPYAGAPLEVRRPGGGPQPDFVGFYRWHAPDPIVFQRDLRVTIQQIGAVSFAAGQEAEFEAYAAAHPVAGGGWRTPPGGGLPAWGIVERVDDYCATAYVYCAEAQPVPALDIGEALADIARLEYEQPSPMEQRLGALLGS